MESIGDDLPWADKGLNNYDSSPNVSDYSLDFVSNIFQSERVLFIISNTLLCCICFYYHLSINSH